MNNPTLPSEHVEITASAQSNPTPLHHQVTVHTAMSNVNAMILRLQNEQTNTNGQSFSSDLHQQLNIIAANQHVTPINHQHTSHNINSNETSTPIGHQPRTRRPRSNTIIPPITPASIHANLRILSRSTHQRSSVSTYDVSYRQQQQSTQNNNYYSPMPNSNLELISFNTQMRFCNDYEFAQNCSLCKLNERQHCHRHTPITCSGIGCSKTFHRSCLASH
jgi:hypothetical protein